MLSLLSPRKIALLRETIGASPLSSLPENRPSRFDTCLRKPATLPAAPANWNRASPFEEAANNAGPAVELPPLEVANLEEARRHLQAHNVEIVGGPRPRGDGVLQMYVCDPDGYIVELFVWEK